MSEMLRLAEADLRISELSLNEGLAGDEVYLNYAGYHCSQAAEKLIKYCIISNGVIPPKIHSVVQLLNYLENRNIKNAVFNKLDSISMILDSWSTETRYIVNPLATVSQVTHAAGILKEVLNNLTDLENRTVPAPEEQIKAELSNGSK